MISKDTQHIEDIEITQEVIDNHGFKAGEYEKVEQILGRKPNFVELGVFSVMWSEHCSYKHSKRLLKTLPTSGDGVLVKAGEENAGVVDIGDGWAVCFKIESHNHPSAIEPFEGAATGVGGILRDIFTMGARPVLLTNSLRFGELDDPKTKRLFRGVVEGISHYGNCMGIANLGGDTYFDKCYDGNPLVNALCLGVLRHTEIKRGAAKGVGNPVYYVGAPTGRDGLGGASFASKELSESSNEDRPAVQKGDPFMEKLLMEACLEMMAVPGLVIGIQDMGAAGLTCSICETAARGGTGIQVDLDKVPAREPGMNAYEYLLSESQERMLVIIEKGRESEVEAIFAKWDLAAVQVGEVKDGDRMVVTHQGRVVVDVPAAVLADEAPEYTPLYEQPAYLSEIKQWNESAIKDLEVDEIEAAIKKVLADPNIAQKRWIWEQYDHMVGANTVVIPGSDAGVIRVKTDDKDKFIAISNDCNNRYCYGNPRRGAALAVMECMRNLACSGARPLGLTNNLNFANPEKPEAFYMLREAVMGMGETCDAFALPVIGGNVSLYNEHNGSPIDPTPVVSVAGLIEHPDHITKSFVRESGMQLVLLGPWPEELGLSAYIQAVHGLKRGDAPEYNYEYEMYLHRFLLQQIAAGRIHAAHDISDGGLLVTALEMVFGSSFGLDIDLRELPEDLRKDGILFGEGSSRIVIAVAGRHVDAIIEAVRGYGMQGEWIGEVNDSGRLQVSFDDGEMETDIEPLREIWSSRIPQAMNR